MSNDNSNTDKSNTDKSSKNKFSDEFQLDGVLEDRIKSYKNFVLGSSKNKMWNIPENELRVYIITNKLLEHSCKICKQTPEWRSKPLNLILDRINNKIDDNDIENLRFLCPNCFSQLKGKSHIFEKQIKSKMINCEKCDKRIRYKTFSLSGKTCVQKLCTQCLKQDKLESYHNSRKSYAK